MKSEVRDEGTVREERDKEDGIRDYSQGGKSVDMMLIKVSSYLRTANEGGRRRNERFWRWGLHADRRRRSTRQRRVILRRRGWGSSEIKGRSD
jgi:hypothetical protein